MDKTFKEMFTYLVAYIFTVRNTASNVEHV